MEIKNNAARQEKIINSSYAIRLQLFGGEEPTTPVEPPKEPPVEQPTEPTEPPKTYTQEELDKLLQAETDRKVSKALETSKAKWEQEYTQKLEKEKEEAARLAKLSSEERQKEIFKKEKEEFERKRKEDLEAFEKEKLNFQKAQLQSQTVKELATKNLPVEFADMLLGSNADSTFENIKNFETTWQQAIEKAVNQKLNTDTQPKAKETPLTAVNELEALKQRAMQSGKVEDRVAYANKKAELNKK